MKNKNNYEPHRALILRLNEEGLNSFEIADLLMEHHGIVGNRHSVAAMVRSYINPPKRKSRWRNKKPKASDQKNWEETESGAHFKGVTRKKITTKEQAIELSGADLMVWKVERWVWNSWSVTTGKGEYYTNYQVKVWFKRREKDEDNKELIEKLCTQIALTGPEVSKIQTHVIKGKQLSVMPVITDLHLGKVALRQEDYRIGWSLEDGAQQYAKAIEYTLAQVETSQIAEVIIPTGNDLLNVDSSNNATTRGTPQISPYQWEDIFEYGFKMITNNVEHLAKYFPVKIIMVKGNHDNDSVFSLGLALRAYFRSNKNVEIQYNRDKNEYHRFGNCLSGFNHGDIRDVKRLNAVMTSEASQDFAKTKFHNWYIGHIHKSKKETVVNLVEQDEYYGTSIEVCPSLCPTDAWHAKNLYLGNLRRSKTFVNHKTDGRILDAYYNLK